jgi:hypothetical protein
VKQTPGPEPRRRATVRRLVSNKIVAYKAVIDFGRTTGRSAQ